MMKVTEVSPSVTMSSRLRYHAFRGLSRNLSCPLPSTRSNVHLTSAAVKGFPSCHLTPWRNLKLSRVKSGFHDQLSASSGWMNSGRFCFSC